MFFKTRTNRGGRGHVPPWVLRGGLSYNVPPAGFLTNNICCLVVVKIIAQNAPDCTDLLLEIQNFPGGHAPGPP